MGGRVSYRVETDAENKREKCLLPGLELLIALSSNPHPTDHAGNAQAPATVYTADYRQTCSHAMKTNVTVRLVQLGYKLDDRGIEVRFPEGTTNFYLYHIAVAYPGILFGGAGFNKFS
jgi:hypothetical protein